MEVTIQPYHGPYARAPRNLIFTQVTIRPVRTPPGRHNGWNIEMKSAKSPEDTRRLFRALIACRPRAVRRRVGGRGNEWFDEELSERRVSYESAVPELPAVAVSREPDASINRPRR